LSIQRYKSFFIERTFDIDDDVNYVYSFIFKPYIEQLKNKTFNEDLNKKWPVINEIGCVFEYIDSNKLKCMESKLAHELKPIYIFGGVFTTESKIVYDRKIKERNYIIISLDKYLTEIFIKSNFDFRNMKNFISEKQIQIAKNMLKESYIKSMIYHELSHWLNSTLHNDHIEKVVLLAKKYENPDLLKLKTKDVNLTHFEIDAQIHGLKQIYKDNKLKWSKLTFPQLFTLYPSLYSIYIDVKEYGKDILDIWLQTLIKRMNRENLLGNNMKIPFKGSFEV
jgi:hypothetical protein